MPADQRTLTLRLSATLATVKSRFQIPGASFRVAFQSTKHTVSEVDIPANGTVDLPAHTKFVMVGTEDSTVQAVVAPVESGDSVTFPVDQATTAAEQFGSQHDSTPQHVIDG